MGKITIFFSLLIFGFTAGMTAARADIDTAAKYVSQAEKVGDGRLSFLFWNVYDAVLYAPAGNFDRSEPFALTLTYLLKLKGDEIAKRSVEEIRKQGDVDAEKLDMWHRQMAEIFLDVEKGTSLTGIRDFEGHSRFYRDGTYIGMIEDKEFTDRFFAIWLGEKTSQPGLRKKLLGL